MVNIMNHNKYSIIGKIWDKCYTESCACTLHDGSANFCTLMTFQRKTHFTFHRRNGGAETAAPNCPIPLPWIRPSPQSVFFNGCSTEGVRWSARNRLLIKKSLCNCITVTLTQLDGVFPNMPYVVQENLKNTSCRYVNKSVLLHDDVSELTLYLQC